MLGGRSIQLARVFGVRIGVDPSWFIVLFLIIWLLSDVYGDVYPTDNTKAFALATVSALLFFLSVVLHELGHALVAIRNGIGIAGIDLWMFGGIAKMKRDTDSAGVEFRVAIAGPLVTLAIVVLCAGLGMLLTGAGGFAVGLDSTAQTSGVELVLAYLTFVNTVLLLFNLIPGFPLDGGRIARAIAWWRTGDRARATRFATTLGRGFSFLMIALGILLVLLPEDTLLPGRPVLTGVWLVLIGFVLGGAARSADLQSRLASRIGGIRVADVMDAQPVAVGSGAHLDRALEDFFLRYRWPWFPVVDDVGRFVGLITRSEVETVPESARAGQTVEDVMTRDLSGTLRVSTDESLERVLDAHTDGLQRLGAVMAVDGDGVLRGVVTLNQVKRALQPATSAV